MIYQNNFEEVDTMNATYGKMLIENKKLIIPFINVAISRHELNNSDDLKYINFCYVVCENVVFIKKNRAFIYENDGLNFGRYSFVYLSGTNLNLTHEGVEGITVLCTNKYLLIEDKFKLKNDIWKLEELNGNYINDFLNLKVYCNISNLVIPHNKSTNQLIII